jgi:VanZ family protein
LSDGYNQKMNLDRGRNAFAALAIVIAGVIYGSLYPFNFILDRPIDAVQVLLATWKVPAERGDFLANIVFYMPMGFFGVRAFRVGFGAPAGFMLAILLGVVLSTGCEIAQCYDVSRVPSANDVLSNTLGAALGAAAGTFLGGKFILSWPRAIRSDPFPTLLLASWAGYRLYPYVPVIDAHKYWEALKPVILQPQVSAYDLFRYTVMWLTVAALTETIVGQKRSRLCYLLLAACVLPAKVMIISQVVSLNEVVGIATGYFLWLALLALDRRRRALAVVLPLLAYVLLWRLEPFNFQAATRPCGWTLFYSFLNGSIEVNLQSFLEKVFYYGSSVWLSTEAGLRIRTAAVIVAAVLLCTSALEIYLPGRSAELTDMIMALVIAYLIKLMNTAAGWPSAIRTARVEPVIPN